MPIVQSLRWYGIFLLLCASLSGFVGCAARKVPSPVLLSTLRPTLPGTKIVEIKLSAQALQKSLERGELVRPIRLVEVFNSSSEFSTEIPQYRIFGVLPGSPLALMNIENADLLVAANDYIVRNPNAFMQYVALLPREKQTYIEIKRNNQPMILRYTIE